MYTSELIYIFVMFLHNVCSCLTFVPPFKPFILTFVWIISSDATGPALPRQFPPGAAVPGVVRHASHHHPPHGNPRGSSLHQPEPGQFNQGLNTCMKPTLSDFTKGGLMGSDGLHLFYVLNESQSLSFLPKSLP